MSVDTDSTPEPNRLVRFARAAMGRHFVLWMPWAWASLCFGITVLVPREYRFWFWNAMWFGMTLTALIAWMRDRRMGPRVVVVNAARRANTRNGAERN